MMKKFKLFLFTICISLLSLTASAIDKSPVSEMTEQQKEVRIQQIKDRVEEIRSMDRSHLSREERKNLRSELVSMKKESKALGGGVYLSVGAIIIIILVLILIL